MTDRSGGAILHYRERIATVVVRYLNGLGYTDIDAAVLARALTVEAAGLDRPADVLEWLDERLDQWLSRVLDTGTDETSRLTARAALVSLEPGRYWAEELLRDPPSRAFITALAENLPIALPPPAPLTMPEQKLDEAGVPVVIAGSRAELWRAFHRRLTLAALAIATSIIAGFEMVRVFSPGGISIVEIVLLVLFAANFFWIALTFWSSLAGLLVGLLQGNALPSGLTAPDGPLSSRTALVMPIYNEDPGRVFAAVETIYRSLAETGELDHFEFFLLSDTTDPDRWIAEELAWDTSRRRLGASGRLFYRRRFDNTGRKAGNLAEFCRRWGGRYACMIVLDADSVMSGETLVSLARLMQANPHAGIMQTIPRLANRNTPFARAHQFASACYGPVLARGLAWWYLGAGNYWGHNAIIHVRAFADHAGMPMLRGGPPFGGDGRGSKDIKKSVVQKGGPLRADCRTAGFGTRLTPSHRTLRSALPRASPWQCVMAAPGACPLRRRQDIVDCLDQPFTGDGLGQEPHHPGSQAGILVLRLNVGG